MNDVPATYFDDRNMQGRAVRVRWHAFDRLLEVNGDGLALRVPRRDVTIEPRSDGGSRLIRFATGGRCEVAKDAGLDALIDTWTPERVGGWANRVEALWLYAMVALVVVIAAGWAILHFGVPWAARKIAFALPADITRQLGDQTLATLDRGTFKPTKLTPERQLALQAEFKRFLAKGGDSAIYQIEFRAAETMGANALALPSGVIVITDELVMLAKDDREILGVLAHECGHVHHRHALRGVLQNSAVFLAIALVTGDVSSATSFGGAMSTYLLRNRFSRDFEREADAHAVGTLRAAGVEPEHLARMLERLAQSQGETTSTVLGYLGSHPPTLERIRAIEGAH